MNYDDVTVIFRTDSSLEDMYRFREVCGMSSDFDGSEDVVDEDGDWEGLD